MAQVRFARWVREESQVRKRVVSCPDAALHYVQAMQQFGEGGCVEALCASASSARKRDKRLMFKWSRRFRLRWHIARTKLAVRDVLARPDLDTKARCQKVSLYKSVGIHSHFSIAHKECLKVAIGFCLVRTAQKVGVSCARLQMDLCHGLLGNGGSEGSKCGPRKRVGFCTPDSCQVAPFWSLPM